MKKKKNNEYNKKEKEPKKIKKYTRDHFLQ